MKANMPQVVTDGTVEGTQVLVDGVDVYPFCTSFIMDFPMGSKLGMVTITFPASADMLPTPRHIGGAQRLELRG